MIATLNALLNTTVKTACIILMLIQIASTSASAQTATAKVLPSNLSPSTLMAVDVAFNQKSKFKSAIVVDSTATPTIHGIAKVDIFKIKEADLENAGATINSKIDDIWTISIPISSLAKLSTLKGLLYFDADMPIRSKLDTAAVLSKANRKLFNTLNLSGFNGSGVIVGVVDSGFDYTQPSFNDSSGVSRIKYVWDQSLAGTPPSGFRYGMEISSSGILKKLGSDAKFETHGTHVLSIATGGTEGAPFIGIAPNSDIILVSYKSPTLTDEYMSTSLSGILDGVSYIFQKATELGKPAVVNLSLGFHMGPHDGTSLFDQACDKMMGNGRILVGAAGNEGMRKLHLGLNFTATDTIYRTFVGLGATSSTSIDSWGEVNKNYCLQVSLFNKSSGKESASTAQICSSDNIHYSTILAGSDGVMSSIEIFAVAASPVNGLPRITIYASNPTNDILKMVVRAKNREPQKVNFWNDGFSYVGNFSSQGLAGYTDGDANSSIGEIGGTGKRIVSVGAYTSKNSYKNLLGSNKTISYYSSVGLIAPFSSKGPTADNRVKPDITAPGNGVVAALNSFNSSYNATSSIAVKDLTYNGTHYIYGLLQGTSMASPIVTGVVALLLQQNPNLTPEEVKAYLNKGSIRDLQTGLAYDESSNVWGSGKVSAIGALSSLLGKNLEDVKADNTNKIQCRYSNNKLDGIIDVVSSDNHSASIFVYDLAGRTVLTDVIQTRKQIDLSHFGNGIYLLKVSNGKGVGKCKIVVNN